MNIWTYICNGTTVVLTTNSIVLPSLSARVELWELYHDMRVLREFRNAGKGG